MNVTKAIPSLLIVFSLAACSRHDPTSASPTRVDNVGSLSGARVELVEEGGFAVFSTTYSVRHDDRAFAFSRRHICSANCSAPLDSASGTLPVAASDSLFNIVSNAQPSMLKDGYGTTPNSADMVSYSLRVTFNDQTKTVRADDGTMPAAMRKIVDAIHGTVAAGRK